MALRQWTGKPKTTILQNNNMQQPRLILGIGELLWDLFPCETSRAPLPAHGSASDEHSSLKPDNISASMQRLGGAPANYAVMAARLGNHAAILSRIGRDDLGRQAMSALEQLPTDTSFVQIDAKHETGRVTVSSEDGEPRYEIHQPAAWDFMELSDRWVEMAERADAVCFGTLAQRSSQSRQTIQTLVAQTKTTCLRILDINLRPPFYSHESIEESLELASVVKLNNSELVEVMDCLGLGSNEDLQAAQTDVDRSSSTGRLRIDAQRLLAEFPELNLVAVTRGSRGSLLVTRNEWHEHPGFAVEVADVVGAGDAYAAALTHYLLLGANLATLNEAGNRWGSWMASQSGAMPELPDDMRDQITAAIEN
jgi:fructokinase